MQFSMIAAVAALAVSVSAISNGTVAYVTETLTEFTTVCPAATTLTYNGVTITATESEVITLPCPCTVVKPVTTTSSVICSTCTEAVPTSTPVYSNGTIATTAPATTKGSVGTTSVKTSAVKTSSVATSTTSSVTTAFTGAANKFAASGASLAGLVGLAAFIL